MLQTRAEFGFRLTTFTNLFTSGSNWAHFCLQTPSLTTALPWENSNKIAELAQHFSTLVRLVKAQVSGVSSDNSTLPVHLTGHAGSSLAFQHLQELGSSQFFLPAPEDGVDGMPMTTAICLNSEHTSCIWWVNYMQVGSQCSSLLNKWCLAGFWLGLSSTFLTNF